MHVCAICDKPFRDDETAIKHITEVHGVKDWSIRIESLVIDQCLNTRQGVTEIQSSVEYAVSDGYEALGTPVVYTSADESFYFVVLTRFLVSVETEA